MLFFNSHTVSILASSLLVVLGASAKVHVSLKIIRIIHLVLTEADSSAKIYQVGEEAPAFGIMPRLMGGTAGTFTPWLPGPCPRANFVDERSPTSLSQNSWLFNVHPPYRSRLTTSDS